MTTAEMIDSINAANKVIAKSGSDSMTVWEADVCYALQKINDVLLALVRRSDQGTLSHDPRDPGAF